MAHQTCHISCKRTVCLTFHVKWRCWPICVKMICTISWMNYRSSIVHVGRICTGTVKREIKIMASHMWKCLGTVLDLERTENFLFNGGKRVPCVSPGFHIFAFYYLHRDADEWKWNLWCLYTIWIYHSAPKGYACDSTCTRWMTMEPLLPCKFRKRRTNFED